MGRLRLHAGAAPAIATPGRLDPRRVALGRIVAAFLRAGWRPPLPSERVVDAITADLERFSPARQPDPLTARQADVLALAAEGLTDESIAGELGVTIESVKTHLKGAYRRLGARNRTHAVALALARRQIRPPGGVDSSESNPAALPGSDLGVAPERALRNTG